MLLPIGFLKTFHRVPIANLVIIGICVALYLLANISPGMWILRLMQCPAGYELPADLDFATVDEDDFVDVENGESTVNYGWPRQPWSLVTSAFLHIDFLHIFFNMYFLFLFGSGLNSDFGHLRYTAFFILAALVSSIASIPFDDAPSLGASGALCGVTGMCIALYPRCEVRFFYLIWIIYIWSGTFEVSAIWAFGFWLLSDLWGFFFEGSESGIGYIAHISGTLFGFAAGWVAVKLGWIESDGDDIISWMGGTVPNLSREARRRDRVRSGFASNQSRRPTPPPPIAKKVNKDEWRAVEPHAAEEPLRMVSDEEMEQAETLRKIARLPLEQRLDEIVARSINLQALTDEQARLLRGWYEELSTSSVVLKPKTQLAMTRWLAHSGSMAESLEAYRRLFAQLVANPPQRAVVAVEAAKYADEKGHRAGAIAFAKAASKLPLSPVHKQFVDGLLTRWEIADADQSGIRPQ